MNDLNAVCAIFIATVNQAKCCGMNSTKLTRLLPVNKKTNLKLENDIYCKFQTRFYHRYKLIAGTHSYLSSLSSTSKDYVKAFS
jgi:hypothetical protein